MVDPIVPGDENTNTTFPNADVNNWIYSQLKDYYLWEAEMPEISATNILLEPEAYFKTLLFNYGETDRFSWIQASAEELRNSLNGLNRVFGWKYQPYYANDEKTRVAFAIQYTLKNSAAERAGIKRGDFITKINGEDLTPANYQAALNVETVTVTMGKYENGTINSTEVTHNITKEVTQTNALQYYTILPFEGKKIGYFVYTQFLTSNDRDLNNMFKEFKSSAIDELVVDLRYNPGGYISSSELLSSLIVKNLNPNQLMTRQIWNDKQTKLRKDQGGANVFDTNFFTSNSNVGTLNNPGTLNRVYFLVSNGSASASELLINNLKPFMDVRLIGAHTYGKNVGSITISDDNTPARWNWGMQPIVLKTVNALGESEYGTKTGFLPDVEVADNLLPFKEFGDTKETLLNATLKDMFGADIFSTDRQSRVSPSEKFVPLLNESITGNTLLDRKDMWVEKVPFK